MNPFLAFPRVALTGAAALLLVAGAARMAAAQQPLPLTRVTGEPVEAELLAWGEDEAVFRMPARAEGEEDAASAAEAETLAVPTDQVLAWGALPTIAAGPLVVLADGGLLVAEPLALRDEMLRVYSASWDEISLPLAQVRGIVYRVPHTPGELDARLAAIRQAEGDRDLITLAGGEQVRGVILGMGPEGFSVETEAGWVEIATDRVAQVVFTPALVAEPEPAERPVAVGFRDGSFLFASSVALNEGQLRLESPGLGTLATPRFLDATEELRLVQPLAGAATYLSDLAPHSYLHVPFLEMEWPLGIDENCLGGMLRAGQATYLKGLGMHSASRAAFNLEGNYRRFQAELALDAAAGEGGSVIFQVFAGTAGAWEPLYTSEVVRGGQPPIAIDLDVSGQRQLLLVVEYADEADQLDRADWLNARVLP